MHWVYGAGFATVCGTVLMSQNTTGPTFLGTKGETKGQLMLIHKSTAVLLAGLLAPRVLLRAFSAVPKALPGSFVEHWAANLSHTALYGFMIAMPATGFAMGWYGGKGVPFFGITTFAGKTEGRVPEDGKFAGKMFGWHKWAGGFLWYLLPLHVGAASLHVVRGHKIFARINPFA
jgi:cytochrome b561